MRQKNKKKRNLSGEILDVVKKNILKGENESFLIASQNNAIRTITKKE